MDSRHLLIFRYNDLLKKDILKWTQSFEYNPQVFDVFFNLKNLNKLVDDVDKSASVLVVTKLH